MAGVVEVGVTGVVVEVGVAGVIEVDVVSSVGICTTPADML